MFSRAPQVRRPHPRMEVLSFLLEAARLSCATAALTANLGRHIEEQRQVGLAIAVHPALQGLDPIPCHAAAARLVRVSGIGEAVAQHPFSITEGRQDYPLQMFAAGGEHEQHLGFGIQPFSAAEHDFAQPLAHRCSARFTGDADSDPALCQEVRKPSQVGGLAGAIEALEGDELAAGHRRDGFWYFSTARSCSTRVREKCEVPSPRETKYSASLCAGFNAALSEARPGVAMGVGGRPAWI